MTGTAASDIGGMHEQPLAASETARFREQGFLALDGWLDPTLTSRLVAEVDARRLDLFPAHELPEHALLTSHPPLMTVMEQLLGPGFLFHHIHAGRLVAGTPGVPWHNDYFQIPQRSRTYGSVVAFLFPDGARGEVGDLVVVPRTQAIVSEWHALSVFGTESLPGEIVIERLAPGSIVLANAGLLHCRRPRPGAGPRYMSDLTYCQRGIIWPSWLQGDWRAMYRHLLEQGCARGGRYDHLYDETQFFDTREALQCLPREAVAD
jgi:hypothetical protein